MIKKNIETVNKEEYMKALIGKTIPAIKAKWPKGSKGMQIKIQQDKAKPHCSPEDPAVIEAGSADGWNIVLTCQPPKPRLQCA
jgi:hypothetical protein